MDAIEAGDFQQNGSVSSGSACPRLDFSLETIDYIEAIARSIDRVDNDGKNMI